MGDKRISIVRASGTIAPEGRIVIYGSGAPDIAVPFVPTILKNVRLNFFIVYHLTPVDRAAAIAQITAWLAAGALQHNIAAHLPLERIVEAHEAVESGRTIGNVVIEVGGNAEGTRRPR